MDEVQCLINILRRQINITELEVDIVYTWDELQRTPFDAGSAYGQLVYNKTMYSAIIAEEGGEESGALRPLEPPITEAKLRRTLSLQLSHMLERERKILRYPRPLTIQIA